MCVENRLICDMLEYGTRLTYCTCLYVISAYYYIDRSTAVSAPAGFTDCVRAWMTRSSLPSPRDRIPSG